MNEFFEPVLSLLEAALKQVSAEGNLISRYDRSLRAVKGAIRELKDALRANPFSGKEEEICYFRDQAPVIYSRLFYFMKLHRMETSRANLTRDSFRRELEKEMVRIEEFHVRHRQLLESMGGDGTYWDICLYTRQGYGDWWAEEEGLYIDEDFTIGSYWVAKNMANAALQKWLAEQLAAADRPADLAEARPALQWTAKKVDLIEVVYALHLTGCINDGKATWKETIEGFGRFLGAAIGNYNVTLQDMARRKITDTKFLDKMMEKLKGKLDNMG